MRKIIDTDIWPALNHCDDCIQFEALSFYKKTQGSQANNAGLAPETEARFQAAEEAAKELETKLLELQDANIALEKTNELNEYALVAQEKELLDQQFLDLEEQLSLLQTESEEKDTELEEMKNFRMAYLEEQYKMHAMFKDSLLVRYGKK